MDRLRPIPSAGSLVDTVPASRRHGGSDPTDLLAIRWAYPQFSGRLTPLAGSPRITIGRDPGCDVWLDDEEVSRVHAVIELQPSPRLRDNGSRNGTYLDGARVDDAVLAPRQVVRIGGWVGLVEWTSSHEEEKRGGEPAFGELADGLLGGTILRKALAGAKTVAASNMPIILQGETGTGKEQVARALHAWSGRRGPFVAINCAAVPEAIAEAQLFGFRKGAFTGADRPSPGFFRSADGGTLLLDEILEMPLPVQSKLLRVLEQNEVTPVGEVKPIAIDVRVLAASQLPLADAVQSGRFRADLAARLDGLTVVLPPLRDRRADVPYLFMKLAERYGNGRAPAMEPTFIERLCLHTWPLNVRELDRLARRLVGLHGAGEVLRPEHLPELMGARTDARPTSRRRLPSAQELATAVRTHDGNLAAAAEELGISRQRAYRLLKSNGFDLDDLRARED